MAREDTGTSLPVGVCAAWSPPANVSEYRVPQALPWRESHARLPLAELSRARALNREGIAARARGDALGARGAYAEAVRLSPHLAPARYNLACEFARDASGSGHDEAIAQLESLFVLGSKEARAFAARARFDADFECLRSDPRFVAMQASIRFDPRQRSSAQLCDDPARIADLVDAARGVEAYEFRQSMEDGHPDHLIDGRLAGKEAFDRAMSHARASSSDDCAWPSQDGSFGTHALGPPKGDGMTACQEILVGSCAGSHSAARDHGAETRLAPERVIQGGLPGQEAV